MDLDGSLKSRPPVIDSGVLFPLGDTGNMLLLGYYYAAGSVPYLLASDGLSSTYYFTGTAWVLLTNTIAASAMTQFNDRAWLVSPESSGNPGGYWTPSGGFVTDVDMPHGDVIVAHKYRLWIARGRDAVANGTRLYFSEVLGTTPFWKVVPDFLDVGAGDGQNIVQVKVYYNSLLVFRTDSIYSFQYTSDPAAGQTNLVVPGVGLADKDTVVAQESYLYFMYDDRAYEFINNRVSQINVKVPFVAISRTGLYKSFAVSVFNNRIIFSYYDTMYVFSLKTRTWTRWRSAVEGPIGKILERASVTGYEEATTHSSRVVPPISLVTNLATNPSFETASGTVTVRTNLARDPDTTATTLWRNAGTGALSIVGGKLRVTAAAGSTPFLYPVPSTPRFVVASGDRWAIRVKFTAHPTVNLWVREFPFWYTSVPAAAVPANSPGATFVAIPAGSGDHIFEAFGTVPTATSGGAIVGMLPTVAVYGSAGGAGMAAGDYIDSTDWDFETGTSAPVTPGFEYLAGGVANSDADLTNSWTGVADASESIATGVAVVGPVANAASVAFQSTRWSRAGTKSLRLRSRWGTAGSAYVDIAALAGMTAANVAGKVFTVGVQSYTDAVRTNAPTLTAVYRIGTAAYTTVTATRSAAAGSEELRITFDPPVGATEFYLRLVDNNAVGQPDSWFDSLTPVEVPSLAEPYTGPLFDGDTLASGYFTYAWSGVPNASTSVQTLVRKSKTLQITDGVTTDAEAMRCVAQTKNYNYEVSSAYKRLFWWGVDAVFRGEVIAIATPVTFNYTVTWGQLLTSTWYTLLSFTWGQPITGTLSVETVRDTSGSRSLRKFVKFMKSLRFRQITFKVDFECDGSIDSAPVRLFSLMTYVKAKERVSKTVT